MYAPEFPGNMNMINVVVTMLRVANDTPIPCVHTFTSVVVNILVVDLHAVSPGLIKLC